MAGIDRMTPSFANALVMTVIEAVGLAGFTASVTLINANALVAESWLKAVERYQRGIRLSTQQPGAA